MVIFSTLDRLRTYDIIYIMSFEQSINNGPEKIITKESVQEVVPAEVISEEDKQDKIELKAQKEKENNEQIEKVRENLLKKFEGEQIKEGVSFIFEQNPELSKIGTPEQYSQYLDTIFPDSKIKDIVYHGSSDSSSILNNGFDKEKLSRSPSFNFIKDKNKANGIAMSQWELTGKEGVISVVLNVENIEKRDWNISATQNQNNGDGLIVYNTPEQSDYYVVFNSEQIHVLGSKQDIEKFNEFVFKPRTEQVSA